MKKVLLTLASVMVAFAMNAQTIFNEGFNDGTIPTGWTMFNDNNTSNSEYYREAWVGVPSQGNPAPCVGSQSWFTTPGTADRWLITPAITIPAEGSYALTLEAMAYEASFPDGFQVKVSTTDASSRSSFGAPIINVPACTDNWTEYSANLSAYAGQTIYIAIIQNSNDMNLLFVDNVKVYQPAENEIVLTSVVLPEITPMGNVNLTGSILSKGTTTLNSFDLSYIINGGDTVTETINNLSVSYNQAYTFTASTPLALSTAGAYNVTVIVSNPNGVEDVDNSDNVLTKTVVAYDAASAVDRVTLLEHFTTGQCPNCPSGHDRVHAALANHHDDVIWLCHHSGYYTDVMTTPADETLCWFYNSTGTYAPATMLDRTHFSFCDEQSPVFFPDNSVGTCINTALQQPSFANIAINNLNYNEATREVSCTVEGNFTMDLGLANPRVTLYLVQDSIIASQSGAGNNYQHDNVFRAAISDVYGDAISGNSFSKTYTYTLPQTLGNGNKPVQPWRCRLIAFVSNYNSADPTDCKILNAAQTANFNATYVGINEVGTDVVLNIFPNPATTFVTIEAGQAIEEVKVVNTLGQTIYTQNNVNAESVVLNTESYANGMYVATVKTANGISTKRFSVVK